MDNIKTEIVLRISGKDENGNYDECLLRNEIALQFMPAPGLALKFKQTTEKRQPEGSGQTKSGRTIFPRYFRLLIGQESLIYDLASKTLSIRSSFAFETFEQYTQAIEELTDCYGFEGGR